MAKSVTEALGGSGIWGVEFFIANDGVYFSELSPRPHDTGMVTLAGTQNFNEFEIHLIAVLGFEIPEITLERHGASAVILANKNSDNPTFEGIEELAKVSLSNFRLFGKPSSHPYRRMGIVLTYDKMGTDIEKVTQRAKELAGSVKVL